MFVDQTVYHGRAEDTNRLDKELRCYDLLDRLGLSYDRVDHDAADTIEACAAVEQVLGARDPLCETACAPASAAGKTPSAAGS